MKNSCMSLGRALVGSAIVLALLLAGCENVSSSGGGAGENGIGVGGGTGTLSLSIGVLGGPSASVGILGSVLRTVAPETDSLTSAISGYRVRFDVTGGGAEHGPVLLGSGNTTTSVVLAVGTYRISVDAFDVSQDEIAHGSVDNVVISNGATTNKTVNLGPEMDGGGQGTFAYTITFPSVQSANLVLLRILPNGEGMQQVGDSVVPISSVGGSVNLASGQYKVSVSLWKGDGTQVIFEEFVHIYKGLTSTLTRTFEDADFHLPPPMGGQEPIQIDLADLFSAPVAGGTPETNITLPDGFGEIATMTIVWHENTADGVIVGETFAAGTAYVAVVTFAITQGGITFGDILNQMLQGGTFGGYVYKGASVDYPEMDGTETQVVMTITFGTTAQGGSASVTIGFNYGTIIQAGGNTTIQKPSGSVALSVNAEAGYNPFGWYVDGALWGGGFNFTLKAGDYAVGQHTVRFEGSLNGVPYSENMKFTVTDEN
jgi:hypothetical protein